MSGTRKEGMKTNPLAISLPAIVLRVGTLATLAVLLGGTAALARCINDRSRSLQDMVTGAQSWFNTELPMTNKALQDAIAKSHPWSSAIPKDFRIDPRRTPFAVSTLVGPTNVYSLPSTDLGARNIGLSIGSSWKTYRDVAECRVQAPDGRWCSPCVTVGETCPICLRIRPNLPLITELSELFTEGAFCQKWATLHQGSARVFNHAGEADQRAKCKK